MMEKYMTLKSNVSGYLTENFKQSELNHSGYASKHGIRNVAVGYAAENQQWLAIVLQLLRNHFGVPISITSGFRSEAVNKAVGGSLTSSHIHGSAADIKFADVPVGRANQRRRAIEIARYFESIGLIYDQIIYYDSWIHVGMRFRSKGRKQLFAG